MSFVGLQYKRWCNEHLGFRVIGAFANYSARGPEVHSNSGDTSIVRYKLYNINMPVLGGGLEAQRHFYKRVYLFAAVELKGGYGKGKMDTVQTKSVGIIGPSAGGDFMRYGDQDVSLLYVGLASSVGAKIQWSKISLGLEIFPVHMSFINQKEGSSSYGSFDFNIGSLSQRLFLNWRF